MLETIITAALTALFVQLAPHGWRLAKWIARPKASEPKLPAFNHLDVLGVRQVEPFVPTPAPFSPTKFLASYDPQSRSFKLQAGKPTRANRVGPSEDIVVPGPDPRTVESFEPWQYKKVFSEDELRQLLVSEADPQILARLWSVPEPVNYEVKKQDLEDLRQSLRVIVARLDALSGRTGVKKDEEESKSEDSSN